MAALGDGVDTVKFVHTYGVGLHSGDTDPDVHDPRWQQRQVEDFVEFTDDDLKRAWLEGVEVVNLALTQRDFTFAGEFFPVERPTTIATRPLQDPLPVWLGGTSKDTSPPSTGTSARART
jgi:alkanesulfonate monooxygenase SsuD/methylene tetrahydromethanopterin reductase-like flavin-dependent oxidoreductase (luciferase family)